MITLLSFIFWLSLAALFVVWIAYPVALALLTRLKKRNRLDQQPHDASPASLISIIIAAHNEEDVIEHRIRNILEVGCSDFEFEIIVMADGCTDQTVDIVKRLEREDPRIRVYETTSRGRANAHNEAYELAKGDLLFFTDAETEYDIGFIDILGHAFDNQWVGFASGMLIWRNRDEHVNASHFSLYWRYEIWLREMETALGIHALGTGACCAVRKSLFLPIPAVEDVDFTTPIDVVLQGYETVLVSEARAFDYAASDTASEFRNRVRMTSKNVIGTWRLLKKLCPSWHCLGLLMHKIGRWLTPFFFLAAIVSGTIVWILGHATWQLKGLVLLMWGTVGLALLGKFNPKIPIASQIWSFGVANTAFAAGLLRAIRNNVKAEY